MPKCNAEFIEAIFVLMFETFWMAPYDPRRSHPALAGFERRARCVSVLLGKTDFVSVSGAQGDEVVKAVSDLEESVRQVSGTGLFPQTDCVEALEWVRRISDALAERCAAGIPSR